MADRSFADSKSASAVGAKLPVAGYAVLSALGPKRPIFGPPGWWKYRQSAVDQSVFRQAERLVTTRAGASNVDKS